MILFKHYDLLVFLSSFFRNPCLPVQDFVHLLLIPASEDISSLAWKHRYYLLICHLWIWYSLSDILENVTMYWLVMVLSLLIDDSMNSLWLCDLILKRVTNEVVEGVRVSTGRAWHRAVAPPCAPIDLCRLAALYTIAIFKLYGLKQWFWVPPLGPRDGTTSCKSTDSGIWKHWR